MSVPELDFTELMQTIIIMSLTGSAIAILLFIIKPLVKSRLPKLFQYYMWLVVIVALVVPISRIIVLPEPVLPGGQTVSLAPIHSVVQQNFRTSYEGTDRLVTAQPDINASEIGKSQSQLPRAATISFFAWTLGVIVFISISITRYIRFSRELRKRAVPANGHEAGLLKELSGMERIPMLCRSPLAPTPMLIGIFRPLIILPGEEYTGTQIRNILLHELTHMRRHDVIIKWMTVIACALHWFNPIVYLIRREINKSCELACDETVIMSLNTSGRQNYGETLIAVVATHKISHTALSTTMSEEKKALKERLRTIMKHKVFSKTSIVLSCILLLVVLCVTIVLGAASTTNNNTALEFPVTADNLTYGSAQYAYSIESLPDLIEAGSINNVNVYIYASDVIDLMPKTLEDMQNGSYLEARITVYEADGKTIAGSADYSYGLQLIPASLRSEYAIPPYMVNENGQTYGTMAFVGPHNPVPPDLIACIGIGGTEGYCYGTDLDGEQPNNPDEAVEYMKRLEARYEEMRRTGEKYVRLIPLYAEDGVTVIGEFGIGGHQ